MTRPEGLSAEERETLGRAVDAAVTAVVGKAAETWGMPLADIVMTEGHVDNCDALVVEDNDFCDCWRGRVKACVEAMGQVSELAATVSPESLPAAVESIVAGRLAAQREAVERVLTSERFAYSDQFASPEITSAAADAIRAALRGGTDEH